MSRRSLLFAGFGLLAFALAFTGLAGAEDPILDDTQPPVRLKKKVRPDKDAGPDKKDERPAKDGDKKNDKDKKPDEPPRLKDPDEPASKKPNRAEEEARKLAQRVLKNMQTAEDRLAKNDPGKVTREAQHDAVKDLDELIKQLKRNPPPQGSSGSSSRRRSSSAKNSPKNSGRNNPKNSPQNSKGNPRNSQTNPKSGQAKNSNDNRGGGGNGNDPKDNKLADLFKDVWGHYPETMRQEIDAYSRAKFLPKYELLLKEYYRTLSEQGSKKQGE
jgi:hypothetical protein